MNKALIAFALGASPVLANPPSNFVARVEAVREHAGVPGIAIAIVENGKPTLVRGWGVRKLGTPDPVDADTIFPTGSTGKAFTVAALATLVDQGRIGWDDKVTDRLPGFQMYDYWVTREMTIRDLLVHRSGLGLGAGDLLFAPRSNIPRAEAVRRLRFIKPATSFRSAYAYDNVLYMVAGQLIEAVTGETWETYVREHLLKPADMLTTTDDTERFDTPNRAFPHARLDGGLRGLGHQEVLNERDELARNAAPAGGLSISANDYAKWITLQLAGGKLPGGGRLFSEAAHQEMWKPVLLQPIAPRPDYLSWTQPMFYTYALGWDVQDYHGARIVWHGGAVFGYLSAIVLIPEKKIGFSIEINSEDGDVVRGLMYELLDHYLGLPRHDWPAKLAQFKAERARDALKLVQVASAAPAKVGPSLPLDRYAGTYRDAWYGDIAVGRGDGALTIDFKSTPRMGGRLEHYQYDTFVTRFEDKSLEPAYVTFELDSEGKVSRVTMKAVSPIADFSYDYQDLLFRPVGAGQ
jgi:CubicO group peptidase (beta-lactamase class C family)